MNINLSFLLLPFLPGQDNGSGQFNLPQVSNLGESSTNISYRGDQKIDKVLVSEGPSYVSPQQSTLSQSENKVDISLSDIMEKLKDMEKKKR